MKNKKQKPTESELEILQILYESGPSTVKFVNEALSERRKTGYTSTLKFMQIMAEKGLLNVNKAQRQHVYAPAKSRDKMEKNLLESFMDSAFSGSASRLVMQLLGSNKTSAEELEKIKQLIREHEDKS